MNLTIHCVRCRKDTRAEKVGLKEAVVLVRQGGAEEVRPGRRFLYWNRCTECGYLYSAPPPPRPS